MMPGNPGPRTPLPVWLLDIDGVINAFTTPAYVWPADQWVRTEAHDGNRMWEQRAARPVLDFIRTVHEGHFAEIRWHTTWQHHAHNVAAVLGLPTFPVQDAPEFAGYLDGTAVGWWKVPAVRRVLAEERRPVVWTDDEMNHYLTRRQWDQLATAGVLHAIAPHDQTGLTPKHLRRIADWLGMPIPLFPKPSTVDDAPEGDAA